MRWIKDFFRKLSLNKGLLAIIGSLSILFVLLDIGNISNIAFKTRDYISLADCLVSSTDKIIFALCYIPLFLFLMQNLMKYDFNTNIILKSKNRHALWNKMCIEILLTSIFFMLFLLAFTCFIGSFYSVNPINWSFKKSYYYSIVKRLNPDIQFYQVLIRFLLVSILRGLCTGMVFQLIVWICNKSIVSWIIILVFNCFSIIFPDLSFLYGGSVTLRYDSWTGAYHYVDLLPVFLFLIGVYLFGYIMSSRKEFLNATN